MGRLFDAVSSLVGVRHVVDYEAEAAIELESLARGVAVTAPYAFGLADTRSGRTVGSGGVVADPGPVVRAVVADLRRGTPAEVVAARFHAAVASLVTALAVHERRRSGIGTVVLGGGVFANTVLLESAVDQLEARRFRVLRPRLLPPNDGGLALGQLLVAAAG
jgi:hydrogenase maturation protein HypF